METKDTNNNTKCKLLNNSIQKEIQIQNENKEIKETKQIDIISNKLREGIDEMITKITILSNKSVEMENTNKELMNKMKQTENIQNQFEDLIKRINSLENQNKNQQKIIDSLRIQVDGTKKNEKDEWIKQDKERIEQMMNEMKLTQEEMTKKEYELEKRRKEAEKYVEEQKKMNKRN